MDNEDIEQILKLLKKSIKTKDWEYVLESIEYLEEYVDDELEEDKY